MASFVIHFSHFLCLSFGSSLHAFSFKSHWTDDVCSADWGLPLLNECTRGKQEVVVEYQKSQSADEVYNTINRQLTPAEAAGNRERYPSLQPTHSCKTPPDTRQLAGKLSAFTLETVRSVMSCSKARVSSACFWLCSAIFSLNFLGFEPPVPGEPDIVRAAVSQLQLTSGGGGGGGWEGVGKKSGSRCWESIFQSLSVSLAGNPSDVLKRRSAHLCPAEVDSEPS